MSHRPLSAPIRAPASPDHLPGKHRDASFQEAFFFLLSLELQRAFLKDERVYCHFVLGSADRKSGRTSSYTESTT